MEAKLKGWGLQGWNWGLKATRTLSPPPTLCVQWSLLLLACSIILQTLPCVSSFMFSFPLPVRCLLSSCSYGCLHVAGEGGSQMLSALSHSWHLWHSLGQELHFSPPISLYQFLGKDFDPDWPVTLLPEQSLFLVSGTVNDQPQVTTGGSLTSSKQRGLLLEEGGQGHLRE